MLEFYVKSAETLPLSITFSSACLCLSLSFFGQSLYMFVSSVIVVCLNVLCWKYIKIWRTVEMELDMAVVMEHIVFTSIFDSRL